MPAVSFNADVLPGGRCAVDGCGKNADDRLCSMHRSRLYRYGSVHATGVARRADEVTPADVAEIKRRHRNLESTTSIARALGLSPQAVRSIIAEARR